MQTNTHYNHIKSFGFFLFRYGKSQVVKNDRAYIINTKGEIIQ